MGRSKARFYLHIVDIDTNTSVTEQLPSSVLHYETILELIESYNPEIDTETISLYLKKLEGWEMFLEDDTLNVQNEDYWFENDGNDHILHMKFHCFYFPEEEEQSFVKESISALSKNIDKCHRLYRQIKQEYIQDPLDINIFWGSPMWTRDTNKRFSKSSGSFKNIRGEELQLIKNQLKYTPYVNAVTDVLQKSQKKLHLYLKPLNENSFTKKNVFTVTYLMAHVQIAEQKGVAFKQEGSQIKLVHQKSQIVSSTQEIEQTQQLKKKKIDLAKEPISTPQIRSSEPTTCHINNKSSLAKVAAKIEELQMDYNEEPENFPTKKIIYNSKYSRVTSNSKKLEVVFDSTTNLSEQIDSELNIPLSKKKSEVRFAKGQNSRKGRNKKCAYNMLGEGINGEVCKITPQVLEQMLENSKYMDLLILHTSFPDEHLKVFRRKAKNIILVNSNPLYPETSTIFFINKLFYFLIEYGNIYRAYEQALAQTQKLKSQIQINTLSLSDRDLISQLNQKYVHGSTSMCCCYHRHLPSCVFNNNTHASKYAEHHYRNHYVVNCECSAFGEFSRGGLMVHTCPEKKKIMQKQYNVLGRDFAEEQFYFCCCLGHQLGYYDQIRNNKHFSQSCLANSDKDPHSIRNKFKYQKMHHVGRELQIFDGKLSGDCSSTLLSAFKWRQNNTLIGNTGILINLLDIFTHSSTDITICNIYGRKKSGRKTIASHFSNLLLVKQLFQRVVRVNVTMYTISEVVKQELSKGKEQGTPFFIFVSTPRNSSEVFKIYQSSFGLKPGEKVNAILITQNKALEESGLSMKIYHLKPEPFDIQNCLAYIKMYKHLRKEGKKHLQTLFDFVRKKYIANPEALMVYPCELNQFQILNIVNKTTFNSYKKFGKALDRIKKQYLHYYLFVVSVIKFTTSGSRLDTQKIIQKMDDEMDELRVAKTLFFKDFGFDSEQEENSLEESTLFFPSNRKGQDILSRYEYEDEVLEVKTSDLHEEKKEVEMEVGECEQASQSIGLQDQVFQITINGNSQLKKKRVQFQGQFSITSKSRDDQSESNVFKANIRQRGKDRWNSPEKKIMFEYFQDMFEELVDFDHIRQHYYLIYMLQAQQIAKELPTLFRMFINYSTLISPSKFPHSHPKYKVASLRIKKRPFHEQVFQATTVNSSSYLSKFFSRDLEQIINEYSESQQTATKDEIQQLQNFLISHAKHLEPEQNNCIKESFTNSDFKERYLPVRKPQAHQRHSISITQPMKGFLEQSKISKESIDVPDIYHIAAVMEAGLQFMRTIISTHFIYNQLKEHQKVQILKYGLLLVNNCIILLKNKTFTKITQRFDIDHDTDIDATTKKLFQTSCNMSLPSKTNPFENQRKGKQNKREKHDKRHWNSIRLKSSSIDQSCLEQFQENQKKNKKTDELLTNELYRLSTYKGLLYLLSQLEGRCDKIHDENIIRTKISVQLLGVQIRLEEIHLDSSQAILMASQKDRHLSRLNQVFNEKNYNIIELKRIIREEVSLNRYYPDADQIPLIKAHIIVALSLMSSGYGQYKLVKDNFMIQQIEKFLKEWDLDLPLELRRGESNVEVKQSQNSHILRPSRQNTILDFMRSICQSQSLYLRLLTSFSSEVLWRQNSHNPEVELYQQMLRLFHLFKIEDTNFKSQTFHKLQRIEQKLTVFRKNKNSYELSTYLHNFLQKFMSQIKEQIQKLEAHLVLTLTAQILESDVKMSMAQKIDNVVERNRHKTQLFSISRKFSVDNLHLLATQHKCNYLCIYASTGKEKEICVQTEDGTVTMSQEKVAEMVSQTKFKVLFICMPKRKNLAQHIIFKKFMKTIVYFDFSFDGFQYMDPQSKEDLLIFQKMIMIKAVSEIIQNVIQKSSLDPKTALEQSFKKVRSTFEFVLTDNKRNQLIRLKNDHFRKSIFLHGLQEQMHEKKCRIKEVKFNHNQRFKYIHLNIINTILNKLRGNQNKDTRDKIEIPENRTQFLQVFMYCFKEKYGFSSIFKIDLEQLQEEAKSAEQIIIHGAIVRKFYESLIQYKVFNDVYSNKKVILIIETKEELSQATETVQKTIDDSTSTYGEDSNPNRHKFHCFDEKDKIQAVIYFFDPSEKVKISEIKYSG